MGITEQEQTLFNEWSVNREDFVVDGVVSETDYLNSKVKLCFVLKEVNDEGGGGWDLREFIRNGARSQTWNNITRWVQCIQKKDEDVDWKLLGEITEADRINFLKSICAMNLKKSPGGHTTVRASFDTVVTEDKIFIKNQYDIYNPGITVCCGTGWDLRNVLDLYDGKVFETSRGIKWFKNHQNNPVIMFAHPAARVQDSLLVYGLIDAIREITLKVKALA
ncbi:hypothetical protein [Marinomonas foliarum]|uniref:Uracil DNA glycosylase superfamily protein n=1 Tax=Marinomonas foliarum TaxID=491950 RepID=A0ABX7IPF4_9GAMM|nr:hypothetical protein [Marinomonas foliarum]QRV23829.1 hypothetical protein JSY38_17730 [Marinomonas foliarum]